METTKCPNCKEQKFKVTQCNLINEYQGSCVRVIQCAKCLYVIGILDTDIITPAIHNIHTSISNQLNELKNALGEAK